jgi:4-diphosphocytidyl-2-C-methyl-D-erythritol kinase
MVTSLDDGIIALDERSCSVRAHAKLNVTLEVLGARDDGFHEVVHVMQELELHDVLSVRTRDDDVIAFTSTSRELDPANNLAVAAAAAIKKRREIAKGVEIELDKRIPIAAGLGGGSSDAAAVLIALNRLWRLSLSPAELVALGAGLGCDVPFFLVGGLALCEGRGERVRALPSYWPASMQWLLLAKPPIGVSTTDAFQGFPAKYYVDGSHSRAICGSLDSGRGFDLGDVKNRMADSVYGRYPDVARTRDALLSCGAPLAELCGTGATVFAPFERLESALRVQHRLLNRRGAPAWTTLLTQARRGRA